jgi:hypothetical protein
MTDSAKSDAAASGTPERTAAGEPLWGRSKTAAFPRYMSALVLALLASAAWCATEALWPETPPVRPNIEIASSDAETAATHGEDNHITLNTAVFSSRKLFIPRVPVESQQTSRAVIEDMLSQLTLTGINKVGDELVAFVRISKSGSSPRGSGRYNPRGGNNAASNQPSETKMVKKGDHLLDFEVTAVTEDGVKLSLAGFDETLGF